MDGEVTELRYEHRPTLFGPGSNLWKLIEKFGAVIGNQYLPYWLKSKGSIEEQNKFILGEKYPQVEGLSRDPFGENASEVAPGLVYQKVGVALWTVYRNCLWFCGLCFRGREVGRRVNDPNSAVALERNSVLPPEEIMQTIDYIENDQTIKEVIISGGDPLLIDDDSFELITTQLIRLATKENSNLVRVRLGTRLPVQDPRFISERKIKLLKELADVCGLYIMLHINHPCELTTREEFGDASSIDAILRLRKEVGANIYSQSVLLKGVNDDPDVLYELMDKLSQIYVTGYRIFMNDPVTWAAGYNIEMSRVVEIWNTFCERALPGSGILDTVKLVIQQPGDPNKYPFSSPGSVIANDILTRRIS